MFVRTAAGSPCGSGLGRTRWERNQHEGRLLLLQIAYLSQCCVLLPPAFFLPFFKIKNKNLVRRMRTAASSVVYSILVVRFSAKFTCAYIAHNTAVCSSSLWVTSVGCVSDSCKYIRNLLVRVLLYAFVSTGSGAAVDGSKALRFDETRRVALHEHYCIPCNNSEQERAISRVCSFPLVRPPAGSPSNIYFRDVGTWAFSIPEASSCQ